MAHIISSTQIACPYCGIIGIVTTWSCGCIRVKAPLHKTNCNRRGAFFEDYMNECHRGSGNPANH